VEMVGLVTVNLQTVTSNMFNNLNLKAFFYIQIFRFVHTTEKFKDAKLLCEDLGGQLAIIKSRKEKDLVGITLSQVIKKIYPFSKNFFSVCWK